MIRRTIRHFDAFLCRQYGVFEFVKDEQIILRLQIAAAPHLLRLGDRIIEAGTPVLEFHLWNDHLPALPSEGPDLSWANTLGRAFIKSLHAAARYWAHEPGLARLHAIGGITSLFSATEASGGLHMMRRLGFYVCPYQGKLGAFGEFWENYYAWWLLWAYNAASLQSRRFLSLQRCEMWMLKEDFLKRFGESALATAEGISTSPSAVEKS